ncbi:hypothetical protein BDV25DRAFT_150674 [Aspergillus avenaceus]|uniref:Uncharacterized protein n=1 Tax=Aspergillus avenaceus TaxID=36643 RepID=A0A5N6U2H7_ASPAV|nr:hypothetical protein BDV25DRAFT_150674 [Aspergillus avenaceus]
MFATPPMHQFNLAQCASAPICPSPLASTQNTTTPTSPPIFSVPTTPPKRDSIPSSRSKSSSSYAQRYANTIANPMGSGNGNARNSSTSPVARAARREAFLNRVKQGRDDARFAGRGEQLVLLEHVKEQKMWGEKMSRGADGILRTYLSELEDGSVLGMFLSFFLSFFFPPFFGCGLSCWL